MIKVILSYNNPSLKPYNFGVWRKDNHLLLFINIYIYYICMYNYYIKKFKTTCYKIVSLLKRYVDGNMF